MCSVSLTNGVVPVNAKDGLVSSKTMVKGGVTSTLGITQDGENVSQLKCNNSNSIAIEEGGAYDIRGNGLQVVADLDEDASLAINSDGSDSSFCLIANDVAHSFSDTSSNNESYIYAFEMAYTLLNGASYNNVVTNAAYSVIYAGDDSRNNTITGGESYNEAIISGSNNEYISRGNSVINVGERAQKTKIQGSETGDDIVNDKAGSTGVTEGKTYYIGRNSNGRVKLNLFGMNALADVRNILLSESNYYGSNNKVFAQDSYKDASGNMYNLQNFLYQYGWS